MKYNEIEGHKHEKELRAMMAMYDCVDCTLEMLDDIKLLAQGLPLTPLLGEDLDRCGHRVYMDHEGNAFDGSGLCHIDPFGKRYKYEPVKIEFPYMPVTTVVELPLVFVVGRRSGIVLLLLGMLPDDIEDVLTPR